MESKRRLEAQIITKILIDFEEKDRPKKQEFGAKQYQKEHTQSSDCW